MTYYIYKIAVSHSLLLILHFLNLFAKEKQEQEQTFLTRSAPLKCTWQLANEKTVDDVICVLHLITNTRNTSDII